MQQCIQVKSGELMLVCHVGYTPAASVIAPQDLTICKKPDGSDFLLGQGTFGAVRPLPHTAHACVCAYNPPASQASPYGV